MLTPHIYIIRFSSGGFLPSCLIFPSVLPLHSLLGLLRSVHVTETGLGWEDMGLEASESGFERSFVWSSPQRGIGCPLWEVPGSGQEGPQWPGHSPALTAAVEWERDVMKQPAGVSARTHCTVSPSPYRLLWSHSTKGLIKVINLTTESEQLWSYHYKIKKIGIW